MLTARLKKRIISLLNHSLANGSLPFGPLDENRLNVLIVTTGGTVLEVGSVDTFKASEILEGLEPGRWISRAAGDTGSVIVVVLESDGEASHVINMRRKGEP